jgi:hypothetical protein
LPVICEDVENVFVESALRSKPVTAVAAMGETAMSPVIADVGTVGGDVPVLFRIT